MEISAESAQEALGQIHSAGKRTRRSMLLIGAAPQLFTWGLAWMIAYFMTYFCVIHQTYDRIGAIWWTLMGIAGIISGFSSWYCFRHVQMEGQWRLGLLWFSVVAVGWYWLSLFAPFNGAQFNLFLATLVMFAWVMIGLILNNGFWTAAGLCLLVLIGGGQLVIGFKDPLLWIWLGAVAGGGMILMGLVIVAMERRHA